MKPSVAIALAISASFSYITQASSEEICSSALIKDVSFRQFSNSEQIAIFLSMDSSRFGDMQESAAGKGGFTIDGIPINFGGDWKKTQSLQEQMRKKYKLDFSTSTSSVFFESRLSAASAEAYIECIRALTQAKGLFVKVKKITGDSVVINADWKSMPGDDSKKRIVINPGDHASVVTGQKTVFGPITQTSLDNQVTIVRTAPGSTLNISAHIEVITPPSRHRLLDDSDKLLTPTNGVLQQISLPPIPPEPKLFTRKSHFVAAQSGRFAVNANNIPDQLAKTTGCLNSTGQYNFFRNIHWDAFDPKVAGDFGTWQFSNDELPKEGGIGESVCGTIYCSVHHLYDNCSNTANILGQEDVFDGWE